MFDRLACLLQFRKTIGPQGNDNKREVEHHCRQNADCQNRQPKVAHLRKPFKKQSYAETARVDRRSPCHNTISGPQVVDAAESEACVDDILDTGHSEPDPVSEHPLAFLSRIINDAIAKVL